MNRSKHLLQLIAIFASITLFTSCYYDQVVPKEPDISDVGPMSFSNDIIPIFNASCNGAGCHNGAVSPYLTPAAAYSSLMNGGYIDVNNASNSELYQWMAGNRTLPMPLSGPNSTYNTKVLAWIDQGALNN